MKATVPPERQLRILAREFRGTLDEGQRTTIAGNYAQAVRKLIRSKNWKEIPPLEDQLPDEWMPDTFFTHWELRPPVRRTAKPAVVTEFNHDIAILRAFLPKDVLEASELHATGGSHTLVSAAREHLVKHHAPVVILLDTNTLLQKDIVKLVTHTKQQMEQAARGVRYDIVCFIPHTEIVFFEGGIDLQRIFPRFKEVFDDETAATNPQQQLEGLLKEGGGPGTLSNFLAKLQPVEVEKVRATDPIRRIVVFITNNIAPVRTPPRPRRSGG